MSAAFETEVRELKCPVTSSGQTPRPEDVLRMTCPQLSPLQPGLVPARSSCFSLCHDPHTQHIFPTSLESSPSINSPWNHFYSLPDSNLSLPLHSVGIDRGESNQVPHLQDYQGHVSPPSSTLPPTRSCILLYIRTKLLLHHRAATDPARSGQEPRSALSSLLLPFVHLRVNLQ